MNVAESRKPHDARAAPVQHDSMDVLLAKTACVTWCTCDDHIDQPHAQPPRPRDARGPLQHGDIHALLAKTVYVTWRTRDEHIHEARKPPRARDTRRGQCSTDVFLAKRLCIAVTRHGHIETAQWNQPQRGDVTARRVGDVTLWRYDNVAP